MAMMVFIYRYWVRLGLLCCLGCVPVYPDAPFNPEDSAPFTGPQWPNFSEWNGEREVGEGLDTARNVILFIGDGMGEDHVTAARMFHSGNQTPFIFETFPHYGKARTLNASDGIPDSAAGGTAIATGYKVDNYVVSVEIPGNGQPLRTALEVAKDRGKRTGVVSLGHAIWDATPAVFASHTSSRSDLVGIATGFFEDVRPNILFGAQGFPTSSIFSSYVSPDVARASGFLVAETYMELQDMDWDQGEHFSYMPLFNPGHDEPSLDDPSLATLTGIAIDVLNQEPNGFFLMVEHHGIDQHSHGGRYAQMIDAVIEFDKAVAVALDFYHTHPDTLILVTADHECGGLFVNEDAPVEGVLPSFEGGFGGGHTAANVPVYGIGPGADWIQPLQENTFLFSILTGIWVP